MLYFHVCLGLSKNFFFQIFPHDPVYISRCSNSWLLICSVQYILLERITEDEVVGHVALMGKGYKILFRKSDRMRLLENHKHRLQGDV